MATAVETLASQPKLRLRMGRAARERAEQGFTEVDVADGYEPVLLAASTLAHTGG
ncbi:MAG TPA: hypothetical protein VLA52_01860 [Thermohalobaculum sp.]|nr:hypothetical protein [Thermohalobaculum sp.]